ncbi:hypothetical protein [Nocardioides sp.]|uniref:hypothetical protein n=1 Tax=Nocardioides sp. TaxID=35761 RepID=UPI003519A95D
MTSLRRTIPAAALAAALAVGLAACGGDDGDADATSTGSSTGAGASSSTGADGSTDGSSGGSSGAEGSTAPSTGASAGSSAGASGGAVPADATEFCDAVKQIVTVMSSSAASLRSATEWKKIQDVYGQLAEAPLPKDATDEQEKGRAVVSKAIAGLSFAEAKKLAAQPSASGVLPGLSQADNKLATDFLTYAGSTCAGVAGQ